MFFRLSYIADCMYYRVLYAENVTLHYICVAEGRDHCKPDWVMVFEITRHNRNIVYWKTTI